MNPLSWKREHRVAFLIAVVFCACIGIFAGVHKVEPSSQRYWLMVGLWGVAGAAMGAIGAFIGQMMRGRDPE
jgi:uncharacterized membrane protein